MKQHAPQLSFRAWLVTQLKHARWSQKKSEDLPELAESLGVTESVLREAIQLRQLEAAKQGRPIQGKRFFKRDDYARVRIRIPQAMHSDWMRLCKTLQIEPSAVVRSLVHHFLITKIRPKLITRSWIYKDKVLKARRSDPGIETRIPRGAQIALDRLADGMRVNASSVTRGLVIDLLEGRVRRMQIVSFGELWGDPDRYLHPEKFL